MASNPRQLALNVVVLTGGEAASKILAFVAFAYLARIFGPSTYGEMEFALAVALFFNLVVEGGLGLLGAREIAKEESAVSTLTFHIVILRCALACAAFLLLVFFSLLSNKSAQEKQLVMLYGLTLFGTPGLIQWVFQAFDRMQWVAAASVIRWLAFAGLVFLSIIDASQIWLVPLIELAAVSAVVVFNAAIFHYSFAGLRRRFDFALARSLLRQALPIGLTQVMWGLKVYLPTIMLGLMVGGEAVGWFGAAHRIVIALHSFVWMYFFNLYPSIARCTQQPPAALHGLIGKSLQVTSWSAVFMGVIGTLLAKPLLTFVYGSQYQEATLAFQVLIWLVAATLLSSHYMYTLIAYNQQWLELLSAVFGAVVNIGLNYVLILRFGFVGAAFGLLFSEASIWALNYYFVRRHVAALPFCAHLLRPLIAGAAVAALISVIPPFHFLVVGMAALLLYALGMVILQPGIISEVRVLIAGNR
jgi:O-antigen/teichoic acid export membrane protein